MSPRGRGRPGLGHQGHQGPLEGCESCWLIAWRRSRGWTQAEAAARIPSGRRYSTPLRSYQEWERTGPPPAVLELLRALESLGKASLEQSRAGRV